MKNIFKSTIYTILAFTAITAHAENSCYTNQTMNKFFGATQTQKICSDGIAGAKKIKDDYQASRNKQIEGQYFKLKLIFNINGHQQAALHSSILSQAIQKSQLSTEAALSIAEAVSIQHILQTNAKIYPLFVDGQLTGKQVQGIFNGDQAELYKSRPITEKDLSDEQKLKQFSALLAQKVENVKRDYDNAKKDKNFKEILFLRDYEIIISQVNIKQLGNYNAASVESGKQPSAKKISQQNIFSALVVYETVKHTTLSSESIGILMENTDFVAEFAPIAFEKFMKYKSGVKIQDLTGSVSLSIYSDQQTKKVIKSSFDTFHIGNRNDEEFFQQVLLKDMQTIAEKHGLHPDAVKRPARRMGNFN